MDGLPPGPAGAAARGRRGPSTRRSLSAWLLQVSERVSPLKIRLISLVVVIVLWEVLGRRINPIFLSYPSAIVAAGVKQLATGQLEHAFYTSMRALVLGYTGAVVVGVPVGLAIGRYRVIRYCIDTYINALYATPLVALIPLVILWLGTGLVAKVGIIFTLTTFTIIINTDVGVRNVSRSLVEVVQAFGAGEREVFQEVVLPATVPFVMAALRLGIGRAIVALVVAEFFTAASGLGAIIINAGNVFKTADMFVPILCLTVLGATLSALMERLERKVAPWKESERV